MGEREVYYNDGWMFLNKRPTLMCLATLKNKNKNIWTTVNTHTQHCGVITLYLTHSTNTAGTVSVQHAIMHNSSKRRQYPLAITVLGYMVNTQPTRTNSRNAPSLGSVKHTVKGQTWRFSPRIELWVYSKKPSTISSKNGGPPLCALDVMAGFDQSRPLDPERVNCSP